MGFLGQMLPSWAAASRSPVGRLVRPYWPYVPLIALLGLLASVLEGVGIGLLIPLVSLLISDTPPAGFPRFLAYLAVPAAGMDQRTQVFIIGGLVVILIAAKGALQLANNALIAHLNGRIGRDVRNSLGRQILTLDYSFFLRNESSALIHIISSDSWFASDAIRAVLTMIPSATALAVFAVILVWVDWRLTLLVGVGAILLEVLLLFAQKRQKALGIELSRAAAKMGERVNAIIEGVRAVRLFGQRGVQEEKFAGASEQVRVALFRVQQFTGSVMPGVDAVTSLLLLAVLVFGYWLGVSLSAITAYLVLLTRAQPHVVSLGRARVEYSSMRGGFDQVQWLLAQSPPPPKADGYRSVAAIDKPLRFQSVSYCYPDGRAALSDVTFTVRPGITTALIGKSGSGKTTIVNLLCRLVEPGSGAILHGEEPIFGLDASEWMQRIAVAGQDLQLLDGSIEDNITCGVPGRSEDVIEAARAAHAHAFVEALPNGYQTRLPLGAPNLSGGQRQRIGLARALYRKPDLLILDEAVNAVDALSEREILQILRERRGFRTAIVISHRQSTLEACEEGIVIDAGRVQAIGPLASLSYLGSMVEVSEQ